MAGGGDILGSGISGTDTGLGGKLGGVGAGDPSSFLSAGGGFGFDPTTMGDIMGDPTGSVGAAQNLDAGASPPTDPSGGIGGAQSGTPTVGQGVQAAPQPAPTPQPTSPDASSAMASAQQFIKPTSFQLGAPQSVAGPTGLESQQPASFNDRFNAAPLSGAVQQTSPSQLADFWNNLDASGAPGTQMAPNAVSVGLSNSAGTATPYAQQSEAGQLPGTAGDLPDQPAADIGTPAAAPTQAPATSARTTGTQAASSGQGQQNEPQTTGQGHGAQQGGQQGGIPQQAQINPQRIIQALMQGGPMGALAELAREAMGGGTQQGPGQYAPSQYADQVPRGYTRQNEPPWAPGYGPSTGVYTTAQHGSQAGAPQGTPSARQGAEGVQGLPGSPSGPPAQRGGTQQQTYGGSPGRANFMRGQFGPPGTNIVSTNAGGLSFGANRAAAPYFQGFVNELRAAGAPIHGISGYAFRNIGGTNHISQHAFGNAIDINQDSRNVTTGGFKQWADSHPREFRAAMARWGMTSGGDWRNPDFGHFEWNGGGTAVANRGPSSYDPSQNPATRRRRYDIATQ